MLHAKGALLRIGCSALEVIFSLIISWFSWGNPKHNRSTAGWFTLVSCRPDLVSTVDSAWTPFITNQQRKGEVDVPKNDFATDNTINWPVVPKPVNLLICLYSLMYWKGPVTITKHICEGPIYNSFLSKKEMIKLPLRILLTNCLQVIFCVLARRFAEELYGPTLLHTAIIKYDH